MFHYRINTTRVYPVPGRHIMVLKGNSGVVYPFYKSTGTNSHSAETWFPWMGYFAAHPLVDNSIVMVKPNTQSVSEELILIIFPYLAKRTAEFIYRMGNDEAIALSCILGGGEWEKYPLLREEILTAAVIQPFLKKITMAVYDAGTTAATTTELTQFNGKHYSGMVHNIEAMAAEQMERLTAEESSHYISPYLMQDKMIFPTTEQLQKLMKKKFSLNSAETHSHSRKNSTDSAEKENPLSPG